MLKSQARQQKSEDNFVNQKCLSSLKLSLGILWRKDWSNDRAV